MLPARYWTLLLTFLLYANRSSALLKLLPLSRKTSRLHIEFERKEPHLLVDNFHAKPDFFYVFMFPQTSQAPGRMAMSMKVEILLRLSGLPFQILSNHFLLGSTSEGTAPFAQYNGHFLDTSAQIVEKVRNVLGERNYPHNQLDSIFFKDDEKLIEFAEKFLYRILMYDRVKRQQSYYDSGPSSPNKQIPKRWTGPGGLDFMLEDQAVREQMLPALPAAWLKDDPMEAEYDFEHELAEKLMRGAIVDWKWKNSLEAQLVAFVDSKLGHFIDEAKLFSSFKSKVMEKLEYFSKIMEKQPTLADISLFAVLIQFLEGPPLNMPNFRRLFADTPIDIESSSTAGETLADELIEEGKIRDVLRDYVKWGKRTFLEMSEEMNFEQSEKQQGDKFHGPYHIETDDLAGLEEVIDFETVDPTATISVTTMEQLADNREAVIAKLKECKLLPSTPEHDANRSPSTSSTVNHRNEVLPAVVQSLLKYVLTRWSSAEERKFFGRLMLHQAGAFLCGLGTENANNEDKGKSKKGKEKGKEKAEDQVKLLHGEKSDMDEEPQVAKTCQEAHLLAVEKLVAQLAAKGGIRFDELAQEAKRLTYTAVVEHIDGLVAQKVRYAIDASAAVSLAKKIGSGGIEK